MPFTVIPIVSVPRRYTSRRGVSQVCLAVHPRTTFSHNRSRIKCASTKSSGCNIRFEADQNHRSTFLIAIPDFQYLAVTITRDYYRKDVSQFLSRHARDRVRNESRKKTRRNSSGIYPPKYRRRNNWEFCNLNSPRTPYSIPLRYFAHIRTYTQHGTPRTAMKKGARRITPTADGRNGRRSGRPKQ